MPPHVQKDTPASPAAAKVLAALKKRNLTIAELARRMQLHDGIVRRYFYGPETPAMRRPSLEILYDMAIAIGVKPCEFDPRLSTRARSTAAR